MLKKIAVAALLVSVALFAFPAAANARYVPVDLGGAGTAQNVPGGAQSVVFKDGAFEEGGETVDVTVDGDPTPTLGLLRGKVTHPYTSTTHGALTFSLTIPADATPATVYSIVAHGRTSDATATFVITIVASDSEAGKKLLAATGTHSYTPELWAGAAILLLGAALLASHRLRRKAALRG